MQELEYEIGFKRLDNNSHDYEELDRLLLKFEADWGVEPSPPIAKKELETLEEQVGIVLPQEYRRFLLEVRNGGNGPGEQLYSLEEAIGESGGGAVLEKKFEPKNEYGGILIVDCDHVSGKAGLVVDGVDRGSVWLFNVEIGNFWFPAIHNFNKLNAAFDYDGKQVADFMKENQLRVPRVDFYTWYKSWLDETVKAL